MMRLMNKLWSSCLLGLLGIQFQLQPFWIAAIETQEVVRHECPINIDERVKVPSDTVISIEKTSSTIGTLCSLTRITTSKSASGEDVGKEILAPVARSYDGFDWENVAGPYSSSSSLEIICMEQDTFCTLKVPEERSRPGMNDSFYLISYEYTLNEVDEAARFFEQSTFGTTRKDLQAISGSGSGSVPLLQYFSSWLHEQIYTLPPTLHRAQFRERATYPSDHAIPEGTISHPCDIGARWRRTPIDERDNGKSITITPVNDRYAISIDGHIRTMVDRLKFMGKFNHELYDELPATYEICRVRHNIIKILYDGNCGTLRVNEEVDIQGMREMPIVFNFDLNKNPDHFLIQTNEDDDQLIESIIMKQVVPTLDPSVCEAIPRNGKASSVFARLDNGQTMIFDIWIALQTNTIENPLNDGGGEILNLTESVTRCSNVPRSLFNEESCRMSDSIHACSMARVDETFEIKLDSSTILDFYRLTGRYIHAVIGLDPLDSNLDYPCSKNVRSRWVPLLADPCPDNIRDKTALAFQNLINQSSDPNPLMKDIYFDVGSCHVNDKFRREFHVVVDGVCWSNVHPNEYNVYDFTQWASDHPGGYNKISQFAKRKSEYLRFPESHSMERWTTNEGSFTFLARLGDRISINDLPGQLSDIFSPSLSGPGTVVCGSYGESNNAGISTGLQSFELNHLLDGKKPSRNERNIRIQSRKDVWTQVVLEAKDQVRQRMAWALSQLLAISPEDASDGSLSSEMFLHYYDIFVRNAFGNYKDVLREVSYSPLMAEMLTFIGSQSQEYIWKNRRRISFADENYAREIMQLFSIGLIKLNKDGTPQIDGDGNQILTYTNDDIEEYARAWTGFTRQHLRGNIEQQEDSRNSIDPMILVSETRDMFPKMGLDGLYVGDRYMLCTDIPSRAYLREGATYRLLGKTKLSEVQKLHVSDRRESSDIFVPELGLDSSLRSKLCSLTDGLCQYPSLVTIDTNIVCKGVECRLDKIQVVQVAQNVFYEYIRPPCVHSALFPSRGHLITTGSDPENSSTCVDEAVALASAACCLRGDDVATHDNCKYTAELMTLETASSRCTERGRELCAFNSIDDASCGKCCNYNGLFWYNGNTNIGRGRCENRVVIDTKGRVAIRRKEMKRIKHYGTLTFFRVHWDDEYPSVSANSCDSNFCRTKGDYCECNSMDLSRVAFTEAPNKEEVLNLLRVGGVPPSLIDYTRTEERKGVKTYFTTSLATYDENVVFEITDQFQRKLFLKNVMMYVKLVSTRGEESDKYIFRNPPTFISATNPEIRDVQYETDAVLDHYFYHQNTGPFLAYRFIQRFGHSNPSPRFVKTVADAFTSGIYDTGEDKFGTNEYGDLAATIAAILLDQESRHIVLDRDPFHGSVREPLLKVIALMRSMEFTQIDSAGIFGLYEAEDNLGQMAHELPSVFSFFRPEFAHPGSVTESALVAPEASLLYKALGMLNGMLSMIKFGLTSCHEGLGYDKCDSSEEGVYDSSMGYLSLAPNSVLNDSEVVDELSTLLTSGRMSATNRRLVRDAYAEVLSDQNSSVRAFRTAQQLIVMSAEFHTNGLSYNTPFQRDRGDANAKKSCKKYKAVVHLFLRGGLDSYNLLVPHSGCSGTVSYDQYADVRGSVALEKNSLQQIDAASSSQPCNVFGIHPRLPFLKELYDEKDVSFVAGIGVLSKPVTKNNFNRETETRLFSHNSMQDEIGRLDPYAMIQGTGALGRIADMLSTSGNNVNAFTVDENFKAVEGALQNNTKIAIDSKKGFIRFNPADAGEDAGDFFGQYSEILNGKVDGYNNVFSDAWSAAFYQARDSDKHYWAQEYTNVSISFPDNNFGNRLKSVAKMIGSRECRGSDRDLFSINYGGLDHHNRLASRLANDFETMNGALQSFVEEIKAQNMWENIVLVVSSDFGRTLTGNSASGTDHGWSGHSFIMGGAVDGGKIHGSYPSDLSENSGLNVGRGRLIPEFPWEAQWNPIAQWLGIEGENELNHALPNRNSFPSSMLLQKENVFLSNDDKFDKENDNIFLPSRLMNDNCEGEGEPITCSNDSITNNPTGDPSPTMEPTDEDSPSPPGPTEVPSNQPSIIKDSQTSENPTYVVNISSASCHHHFGKQFFVPIIILVAALLS